MTEAGPVAALLPVEVLDAARADLADLRLVDPAGSEVAYALERTEPAATQVIPPAAFSTSVMFRRICSPDKREANEAIKEELS